MVMMLVKYILTLKKTLDTVPHKQLINYHSVVLEGVYCNGLLII